jgi:hypothetical protein
MAVLEPVRVLQSLSSSLDKLNEDPRLIFSTVHFCGLLRWRAGSQLFVNLHVRVPGTLTAFEFSQLEEEIVAALKAEMEDVKDVQVQLGVVSGKDGEEETLEYPGFIDLCVIIAIVFSVS